jgi:hypothetical protein
MPIIDCCCAEGVKEATAIRSTSGIAQSIESTTDRKARTVDPHLPSFFLLLSFFRA